MNKAKMQKYSRHWWSKLALSTLLLTLGLAACGNKSTGEIIMGTPTLTYTAIINSGVEPVSSGPNPTSTQPITALPSPTVATPTLPNLTAKPPATVTKPLDWTRHWLEDNPCHAPCWEGITPGVTTRDEALQILRRLSFATNIIDEMPITSRIIWNWHDSNNRFTDADILYSEKEVEKKVSLINLTFPAGFETKEILQKFGEPDYVWAEENVENFLALVFLKQGITVTTVRKSLIQFNENSLFTQVKFTTSGTLKEYEKKIHYPYSLDTLPGWQGYKSFNYYWNYGR